MADTSDLKSDEVIPHEGSSPSSGITYNDLTRNPNQTLDGKTYPGISLNAILDDRIKMYKELIKDPNHPYLKYLEELKKKYESI